MCIEPFAISLLTLIRPWTWFLFSHTWGLENWSSCSSGFSKFTQGQSWLYRWACLSLRFWPPGIPYFLNQIINAFQIVFKNITENQWSALSHQKILHLVLLSGSSVSQGIYLDILSETSAQVTYFYVGTGHRKMTLFLCCSFLNMRHWYWNTETMVSSLFLIQLSY